MMKNVTLSADEKLILRGREKARREGTTLNEAFRGWLQRYAGCQDAADEYGALMDRLDHIRAGRRQPGLLRQHLTAVAAAAEVGQTQVRGASLGSARGPVKHRALRDLPQHP